MVGDGGWRWNDGMTDDEDGGGDIDSCLCAEIYIYVATMHDLMSCIERKEGERGESRERK